MHHSSGNKLKRKKLKKHKEIKKHSYNKLKKNKGNLSEVKNNGIVQADPKNTKET